MDTNKMDEIAKRVAAKNEEGDSPALQAVDEAIDSILIGVRTIEEQMPNVETTTPEEEAAKKEVIDLIQTAINPYMLDMIENMDKLDAGEEG